MEFPLLNLITLLLTFTSIYAIAIDDFHCKVPTCRDFHYGLMGSPRHKHYVKVCYDTVYALQGIPAKQGKCIDDAGRINAPCIHALANTIRYCINELQDLPEKKAKFYCGFTLMKYCAVHLGLENVPLISDPKS